MYYIHSLSRPWFSSRRRDTSHSTAVAAGDALASSLPCTEQQVPTVNKHPEVRNAGTTNAGDTEPAPLIDTAAIQPADEQLKPSRALTSDGEHIDNANTDEACLHSQDSGTGGLTMEAKVEFSNGAKQQGILAHRQQGEKKVAPKQTQRSSLPSSKRQLAKALDCRKPGFADPHGHLQAMHHASQISATSKARSKKLKNEITALTNRVAECTAKLLEADKKKQSSDFEYDRLLELLKALYREAGVPEDQIEGEVKSLSDSWTEAARQEQEATAAEVAEAQAADDWLMELSATPSQSCLKGRKATAGTGKASQASLDDNDNEEVVTDITPYSHEGFDQVVSSSFAKHAVAAHRSTHVTPHPASTPHTTAQSAPSHVLAPRQIDIIRLENLSKRALADWKEQMRDHRARVHIDRQPSNLLADKDLRIFSPRDEELLLRPGEVWKLDLHTPKWLRDRGCSLEATLAADAVEVYLKILQTHLFEFLPGEGNTVVTGRGLRTGGRTFMEVGQMLHRLLGTVVSRYTAHEDCGAYTVWLLCPSKADRRLRMR
ncbi:hypothetical protein WJX77_012316 [Trebouxia sp. C0004]